MLIGGKRKESRSQFQRQIWECFDYHHKPVCCIYTDGKTEMRVTISKAPKQAKPSQVEKIKRHEI